MAYTTSTDVRKVLPNLLISEDYIGTVTSGTAITLNVNAIACPTILKDTTTLVVDTDYTFVRPDAVTLGVAASGENFIATVHTGESDTVLDGIITQADEIIDDYFYQYSGNGPGSAVKASFSKWLSAALYLYSYGAGSEEDVAKGDMLYKQAFDSMKRFKANTAMNTPTRRNINKTMVHIVN